MYQGTDVGRDQWIIHVSRDICREGSKDHHVEIPALTDNT